MVICDALATLSLSWQHCPPIKINHWVVVVSHVLGLLGAILSVAMKVIDNDIGIVRYLQSFCYLGIINVVYPKQWGRGLT